MTRPIAEWTLAEFQALPALRWNENPGQFGSAVVVPVPGELHDSGFRMMDLALCRDGVPFARRSSGTDSLHLVYLTGRQCESDSMRIDCLPCGLVRIFAPERLALSCGPGLSSMDLALVNRRGG